MSEEIMIPKALPEKPRLYLNKGVHLLKVSKVEILKDDKGVVKLNKNKDKGIKVTFANKEEAIYSEVFWLGVSTQWRLDKFLKDLCVDNTKGDLKMASLLGKFIYVILKDVYHLENGK